jgi:hypothetical protein
MPGHQAWRAGSRASLGLVRAHAQAYPALWATVAAEGSAPSASVDVYHAKTNEWQTLAHLALPEPRAGAGVVALGGRIYVCGGSDGTKAVATVWSIDPRQVTRPPPPPGRPALASPRALAIDDGGARS